MRQLLEISPYNPDHFTFIYELNKAAIDMAWCHDDLSSTLVSHGVMCLVGQFQDQPQGFIIARAIGDEAEILLIAVLPQTRRSGVGGALVNRCVTKLQTMGVKKIFLEVSELNPSAISFYEKNNFIRVGLRKNYYSLPNNIKATALVLCRTI